MVTTRSHTIRGAFIISRLKVLSRITKRTYNQKGINDDKQIFLLQNNTMKGSSKIIGVR